MDGENREAVARLQLAADREGEGRIPVETSESTRNLRAAAEKGDAVAQVLIGHAYQVGQGVPKDMSETSRWYALGAEPRSTENTNGDAQPEVKDFAQAFDAYRKLAGQGDENAQLYLGLAGLGVIPAHCGADPVRYRRLQRAALQGYAPAQTLLSLMYATGQGVGGSTPEAYMWINLASARNAEAHNAREQIEKVMPSEEVAEGQRLTYEWLMQDSASGGR